MVSAGKNPLDPLAQFWKQFPSKPGIALQPGRVARGRVRQRNEFWRVLAPCPDRFSQCRLAATAQKMALSVMPDEQSQFDLRQPGEQVFKPQLRTFRTRRQVTAIDAARIAVAHRNDGNARFIIKDVLADSNP